MKSGLKINVYRQSKINKRETRKISGPRGECEEAKIFLANAFFKYNSRLKSFAQTQSD